MDRPDADAAIEWALDRLRTELSPELTYHNLWHTECDVLPAAERLAELSGLNGQEADLLRVAAAFHDLGFVEVYEEHEERGAEIAGRELPAYGFSPEQVAKIQSMIRATRLPQSPQDLLEALLVDADLDVLGRDNFFARNQDLRQELVLRGEEWPMSDWLWLQLDFMTAHAYFTDVARKLRQEKKEANIASLRERLCL